MTANPATTPSAPTRDRATWAELFYDLVLVFGIGQAAHILAEAPSWGGMAQALLVLLPLWWAWVSMTLALNAVSETNTQRLLLFAAGLATFTMGVSAPLALEHRGAALLFAGSYLGLRVLMAQCVRCTRAISHSINHHNVGWACATVLVAGALLPAGIRGPVWATGVLAEIAAPVVHRDRLHRMTFGPSHLPERFGLFIIIALGECVLSAGLRAATSHLDLAGMCAVVLSFVTGCALWWLYFHYVAPAVEHALRTHRTQAVVVRDVLSYGHFILVVGLLLVAVGTSRIVSEPTAAPHTGIGALVPIGAGLFTLTFGYTRWRMFGGASSTRVIAGLCLLLAAPAAPLVPGLVTLAVTAAVLIAVNGIEYWMLTTGRTIPLFFRRAVDLL
ncbi:MULTISPECIES: low temperature requirement protein A [Kitasatospora]|uniref:Low temperature requirement protein A n=1 Tax=Kitasatospora cystarginea TaxID=58350 RepID=A0ABN3ERY0_9ACTN